ncbi:MAG TPA: MFS transporter [Prolixibacteraceae bacterium]|nr:MFS transporter [Prolixibacteraceae bacterium]
MNFSTFNSLKNRNYRLFFLGQSVSLWGTWMQKTAVSWVVYSLTQSEFMLGVSVFATLFPTALFSLYGGIVADRYSRYKVLLATQIISLLQAVLLTLAVVFFKQYVVWEIIALSAVLGIINGFDVPARQSLVRELVDDNADLPNALALNSSMVNLSKLIGPAIAGFILERFGDAICFGLNAVSFIAVIISLLLIKLPKQEPKPQADKNLIKEFSEAFAYIKNTPVVSSVIIFVGVLSLLVLPFVTLTPVFAQDVFNGSASTLGIIDGVIGFGAFIGALFLASLPQRTNLSKVLALNTLVFGIGLILFSQIVILPLALLFIAIGAFGMMSIRTISNTIVQINVPNQFRGRVISIYLMVITTMMPIGSLIVGAVSHYAGVQTVVLSEGFLALILAVFYGRYLKNEKLKKAEQSLLEQQELGEFIQS